MMTKIVVFGTVVALIAYDVYAFMVGGQVNTISWTVWSMSKDVTPLIPFCAGVVCGHLFWRMKSPEEYAKTIQD